MREIDDFIENLRQELPPAFARKESDKLIPGVCSAKTQANLSSKGEGPPSYRLGRTVIYNRDAFLDWLRKRLSYVKC